MKYKFLTSCILLCLCLVRDSFAQEISQDVGTLFTTPEERAYLNFLREEFLLNSQINDFNIDEVVPTIPVIDVVEEAPTINAYTLGGIFTRQDGSRTVWLNDVNIDENNLPQNMRLVSSGTSSILSIQLDSGRFDLRAGQTLDVVNSRVVETWQITNSESSESIDVTPSTNTVTNTVTNAEAPAVTQLADLDDASLTTEITEPPDPLPELNVETMTISADEISAIINSDDPEAVAEFMQTLQNFEEVQIDDSVQ